MTSAERFWQARLRWRLRGAWMWPTFFAVTLVDGLVLHLLPPIRTGVDLIPALIIATFGNLILVVGGIALAWIVRETGKRPRHAGGPPPQAVQEVTANRAGTALILVGLLAVVAAGLAARPTVVVETEEREQAAEALRDHILRSGDPELIRNAEASDTIRLGDGYFRTCVPRDDRRRRVCFLVDTARRPVEVKRHGSTEPNSRLKAR